MGKNNGSEDLYGNMFGGSPSDGADPRAQLAALLIGMGGMQGAPIIDSDMIDIHDSKKIALPKGMPPEMAIEILERYMHDQETEVRLRHIYRYRANDGAVAATTVLKRRYGITFGEARRTMFGKVPPEARTVKVGLNKTVEAAWDDVSIPSLDGARITLYETQSKDDGMVFAIQAYTPKKHSRELNEMFEEIEKELRENSIYRGKAIFGAEDPEFLDIEKFDASQIVFAKDVQAMIDGMVLGPIRYRDAIKADGGRTKRTVLLWGPYGTGKTSAGQITAQVAVEHGWTYIAAKPGDDVDEVMQTARLYEPAVVFFEDVDNQTSFSNDPDRMSALLDAFDGITSKGGELIVIMTTNNLDAIHKGMLRPGRLDAIVEVTHLDDAGIERLIKVTVPTGKLADDVDYTEVCAEMNGFYPAFVREAVERAKSFAISRSGGNTDYLLTTSDLVASAKSLKPQLDVLEKASEKKVTPDLTTALENVVRQMAIEVTNTTTLEPGGYTLRVGGQG